MSVSTTTWSRLYIGDYVSRPDSDRLGMVVHEAAPGEMVSVIWEEMRTESVPFDDLVKRAIRRNLRTGEGTLIPRGQEWS